MLNGKAPPKAEGEQPPTGEVVDLMAALNASVQGVKESRGETGEDANGHDIPKKRAAKKTTAAAKKTPARKAPAKKASGPKSRSA
ncbi:hypothetical protein AB0D12_39450 [Streptomyces sp. NPDC048479]|uniref:hypothetical protein n=1 Tax=Streptomyces sp. NPDC048479 TaxID=3154725 RepID=UPI003428BEF1